jgi:hypothetical protein
LNTRSIRKGASWSRHFSDHRAERQCRNQPSWGRRRRPVLALTPVALRAPSVRAKTGRIRQTQVGPNQSIKRGQIKLTNALSLVPGPCAPLPSLFSRALLRSLIRARRDGGPLLRLAPPCGFPAPPPRCPADAFRTPGEESRRSPQKKRPLPLGAASLASGCPERTGQKTEKIT